MRSVHLLIVLWFALVQSVALAGEPVALARVYKNDAGKSIAYQLITPASVAKETRYPLVVHLHGAGERGSDNQKQLVHFYGKGKGLGTVDAGKQPYFAIAPQCPDGEQWVNVPWAKGSYEQGKISDALELALGAVDAVIKEQPIDSDRIYITGLSMGGYGTWDAIIRRPNFFAAAVPICGAGDPGKAKLIAGLPVWVWHGDADNVVPVSGSRDMVEAIAKAGGEAKYSELKKVGHNSWAPAYADATMWEWMFKQKRSAKK